MRISDWSSDVCSSDLFLDLGNQSHAPVLELRLVGVELRGVRQEPFLGNLLRRIEHAVEAGTIMHREARRLRQRIDLQQLVQQEIEIASFYQLRHCGSPRSEEGRVGTECGKSCNTRGSPDH